MLYTSTPLERIYKNQVVSLIQSRNKNTNVNQMGETYGEQMKYIDIEHGKIYAKREGENYIVQKINSTNMSDYLNTDYTPGSIVK